MRTVKIATLFLLQYVLLVPLAWTLQTTARGCWWLAKQCERGRGVCPRMRPIKARRREETRRIDDDAADPTTVKAVMVLWQMSSSDARRMVLEAGPGSTQEIVAKLAGMNR